MGGAFAPVAAVTSSHQELPIGCLWFTRRLSGAWQGRKGDHVWEKRCSGLDLLGCDPGSGYAARGVNTRESEVAYRSVRLRDDVRAASSSSLLVCRIVGAPPLCPPARVIPGRTLLEGEGRVGYQASPQVQSTPSVRLWGSAGVPVPVPPKNPVIATIHRPHHRRCHRDWCVPGAAAPGHGRRSRSRCSVNAAHREWCHQGSRQRYAHGGSPTGG